MPLVHERINKLTEAAPMLGFLFADAVDLRRGRRGQAARRGRGARSSTPPTQALTRSTDWTTEAIEAALRAQLVERAGLKPRNAFGPVRVAITGRRVSPPLFESMELLGRDVTLDRLATAPHGAAEGEPANRRPPRRAAEPVPYPEPVRYPQLLRTPAYAWWRPLVGVLALLVAVFALASCVLALLVLLPAVAVQSALIGARLRRRR